MKEKTLERLIASFLLKHKYLVIKIANEATWKRRISSVMRGAPDLCVITPFGEVVWLEIKTPTGRLSKAQKIAHKVLIDKYLQKVYVVRGIDEVVRLFNLDV